MNTKKKAMSALDLVSKNELMERIGELTRKIEEYDSLIFEMRALLQSGKGLGDILNLNSLLDSLMAVVRERYGAINSAVLLISEDKTSFRVARYFGLPETYKDDEEKEIETYGFEFPKIDGLLWQIIQQGDVFSVQDYKQMPRFKEAWKKWNLQVLNSDVWCPLLKKGEVKGILTLGICKNGKQISQAEYGFVQDLSSIATTNIDAVLKYEKNEIILKNVRTLYDVNQQLANVNSFKMLCQQSLETTVKAVKAKSGNLMLFNPETEELELTVVYSDSIPQYVQDNINQGINTVETKTFKIGEGIAGKCALLKKPIKENDKDKIEQIGQKIVYCMLSVPLIRGNEIVGVINMTNKVKKDEHGHEVLNTLGRYTAEDETLVVGLADQAASNLHKSKLYNASITDKMTGLFNTRHFEYELEKNYDICKKNKSELSLVVLDIDHFKKFNDTHGHKAGDRILVEVASKLDESCNITTRNDMAFRYGGEEFCMLLPNTDVETTMKLMEDYRKTIDSLEVEYDNKILKVTVSIGISNFPSDCSELKDIFLMADKALYACKEGGRNQVRAYFAGQNKKFEDK